MFVRLVVSCIAVFMLIGMVSSAMAHRAPGSLTSIEWNETSERTEIIHRLHVHDAETGASSILGLGNLSVADIEDRAHIALYVEERFQIKSKEETILLELIGAEISGAYLLVYQESPDRLPQDISIQDRILLDVFPQQLNQVNVEDSDGVHSLLFTKDVDWLNYRFAD